MIQFCSGGRAFAQLLHLKELYTSHTKLVFSENLFSLRYSMVNGLLKDRIIAIKNIYYPNSPWTGQTTLKKIFFFKISQEFDP